MRNITLFSVLVIISFSLPVYADEISENKSRYAFSITPNTGFLWGRGEEIVYHGNPPQNNSKYLSQLLWDYKPLLYVGLDMDFGPRFPWAHNGFHASLGLKYGLPLETGVIEDYDWLSNTGNYLTNYSRHEAFSRSSFNDFFEGYGSFIANLSLGYSWAISDRLWFRAYGDFSFSRFSWKSRNGFIQYGPNNPNGSNGFIPWDPEFQKNYFSAPAIDYTQNWYVFAPGISAGLKLNDYLGFSFFMAITPLIYGACRDDHLAAEVTYYDYLYGGLFVRAGSELAITFNDRIGIFLSFSIMDLSSARGDNYTSKSGKATFYPSTAGGGFSFLDLSLGAKFTF
jgi:outer membrane protease